MRFIHTGDWHLGRLIRNLHLTDDQRFTLEALVERAVDLQADAVVIAGDVYDRAVPPTEAVKLLDDVLAGLALERQIPVVMIAGNHDSAVRLEYLNGLVGRLGVHVVGEVAPQPEGVEIIGRDGVRVVFWPLAYTDPETARGVLGRDDIHTHEAALAAQLESIRARMDPAARHVVVGHAFVTGATSCESERPLTVGGSGEVSCALFDGFDYVALGHLHRPQNVAERVRYAGSLLKYSFDEAEHAKSVTVVDLDGDGALRLQEAQLPVRRDLVRLRGTFAELLDDPHAAWYAEAYVEVTLTDGEAVLDPMERLRAVYPHILALNRETLMAEAGGQQRPPVRGRSPHELFAEFFADMSGRPLSAAQGAEVADALAALERERREADT